MINRFLQFILLLGLIQSAYAQDIPDFSANYKVAIKGIQAGELKRELSTDENGIRTFTSQSQAKGMFAFFKPDLVVETSIWKHDNQQIKPQSYLYERTGGKKEKYLNIDFDWQQLQVNIDDHKQTRSLNIEENTLDKLVYQLALMSDLDQHKTQLSYVIVDKSKLRTYDITILETETIATPLGEIETIKLTRQREDKNDRQTTLWCAPELHYLPVRIEHIEKDGSRFTAEIRRLKGFELENAFSTLTKRNASILN